MACCISAVVLKLLESQTKVLLCWDHTDCVGVAPTTTPALNTDNVVTLVDNAQFDTVRDTPLKATVDILLPALEVEVGLPLVEEERPYTSVKVGILFICQRTLRPDEQLGNNDLPGKQHRYE